jgi:hypothetical protein
MPFDHGWAPFNHGVASFNHGLAQFNHPRPPEQQRAVAVIPATSGRIYHQGARRPREDSQGGRGGKGGKIDVRRKTLDDRRET